jgi:Arm DNA-binding domain
MRDLTKPTKQFLTDDLVRNHLPPPAKGAKIYRDADVPDAPGTGVTGYGVRITAKGVKALVLEYRDRETGDQKTYTIGRWPRMKVERGRDLARTLRAKIEEGLDPQGERVAKRNEVTVSDLADRFEREHLPMKKPSTAENYARLLRLYVRPHLGKMRRRVAHVYRPAGRLRRRAARPSPAHVDGRCPGDQGRRISRNVPRVGERVEAGMISLEQRLTSALSGDILSSDLAGLIVETEAATNAAQVAAEAEPIKALDPVASPDAAKARAAMEDAAFTRDRLRTVLPRLRARLKEVEAAEYLARRPATTVGSGRWS